MNTKRRYLIAIVCTLILALCGMLSAQDVYITAEQVVAAKKFPQAALKPQTYGFSRVIFKAGDYSSVVFKPTEAAQFTGEPGARLGAVWFQNMSNVTLFDISVMTNPEYVDWSPLKISDLSTTAIGTMIDRNTHKPIDAERCHCSLASYFVGLRIEPS